MNSSEKMSRQDCGHVPVTCDRVTGLGLLSDWFAPVRRSSLDRYACVTNLKNYVPRDSRPQCLGTLVSSDTRFKMSQWEDHVTKRKGGLRAREWDPGGHWLSGGNCNQRARYWRTDQALNWNPVCPNSFQPADRHVIPLLSLQFFLLVISCYCFGARGMQILLFSLLSSQMVLRNRLFSKMTAENWNKLKLAKIKNVYQH